MDSKLIAWNSVFIFPDKYHSASYLRQSILLSPFETPEFWHLFNGYLKNVAGKKRIESSFSAVQVPEGISQVGFAY